ncbi:hypothetical protein A3K74_01770 [Candidatus Pacearchaeota archaeon RBG_13_33_26]|nr:MAG: hypothetical protein A3K74_01770 [Candidatus Pacearchaeota archaeon RBG_13_33_26]
MNKRGMMLFVIMIFCFNLASASLTIYSPNNSALNWIDSNVNISNHSIEFIANSTDNPLSAYIGNVSVQAYNNSWLFFNGVNSSMNLTYSPNITGSTSGTIFFRTNTSIQSGVTDYQYWFDSYGPRRFLFLHTNVKNQTSWYINGTAWTTTTLNYTTGEIFTLTFTWGQSYNPLRIIYKNGIQIAATTAYVSTPGDSGKLILGSSYAGAFPLNATIDDLIILNASLTPNQILDLQDYREFYGIPLANMPDGLTQHCFEALGDAIYAVGGISSGGQHSNKTFQYNITTNAWTNKSTVPIIAQSPVCRAVNGKLYFIGGLNSTSGTLYNTTYEYDPATDIWTKKTDCLYSRGFEDASSAMWNNSIYVFSGLTKNSTGSTFAADNVTVYYPDTDTWVEKNNMPFPRTLGDGGVTVGDKIYLVSGQPTYIGYPSLDPLPTILEYNPLTDTWNTSLPNMSIGVTYVEVEAIGDMIYVIGGTAAPDNTNYTKKVEMFNITANTWTNYTYSTPYTATGQGTAKYNNTIYWNGGSTISGYYLPVFKMILGFNDTVVEYHKFEENKGTTAYDSSGKGNNGTIDSATWQNDGLLNTLTIATNWTVDLVTGLLTPSWNHIYSWFNITYNKINHVDETYVFLNNTNSTDSFTLNIYNLTNALIYYGNYTVLGSADINSNDGNVNITLPPNNFTYILDEYNLTEGTARDNNPLWYTGSSTNSVKYVASNLTNSINTTLVFNVDNCSINYISYTSHAGSSNITYTPYGWNCFNNKIILGGVEIEQATGSNTFTISYTTSPPSETPGSTGGGGSSAPVYKPSQENLEEGYEIGLMKNAEVKFNINNGSHSIILKGIMNGTAMLTLSSELIEFNLTLNEVKKFNLIDDDYYDLAISLKNITYAPYDRVYLLIQSIYEKIPEKEKQEEIITGEEPGKILVKKIIKKSWIDIALITVIALIIIVLIIINVRRIKNKTHKKRRR